MGFSAGAFTYTGSSTTFSAPVTGTTISSTAAAAAFTETASGLSTCLLKDGTQTVTANIPMATFKFTGLGAGSTNGDSVRWQQSSAGVMTTIADMVYASAANTPARLANGVEMFPTALGRLTLTTAVAVTTADVTGATTVYFTPYKGAVVSLYDGTSWLPYFFSELSQATTDSTKSPAAVTTNSNYDVFVWSDSGTLRATRGPAWTSGTGRGTGAGTTELVLVEGRYLNAVAITNGPAAQRGLYVGTIRSDASSQINDSAAKRHVWNMYNRVPRQMRVVEATNTWTYTTAAYQQANAASGNQLAYVVGLNEDEVSATAIHHASNGNATAASVQVATAIGVDSSTAGSGAFGLIILSVTDKIDQAVANYRGYPGLGSHELRWLEYSEAANTTTWYGDNGGTVLQSGIQGSVMA